MVKDYCRFVLRIFVVGCCESVVNVFIMCIVNFYGRCELLRLLKFVMCYCRYLRTFVYCKYLLRMFCDGA